MCGAGLKFRSNATFGIGKENLFGMGLAVSMISSQFNDIAQMACNDMLEKKGYNGDYKFQQARVRLGSNLNRSAVTY